MTLSSTPRNKQQMNWKDWCIQVFERVAESGGTCACMPLPFDGRTVGEGAEDFDNSMNVPQPPVKYWEEDYEEDEVICIDDLYLHKTLVEGTVADSNLTAATKPPEERRSSASTASPFSLLPRPSSTATTSTNHARFYDSRSFDSLSRSTDTGAVGLESSPLQRELPSFGTHRTAGTHQSHNTAGNHSNDGMSSYSQAYTPALSSYLYRHKTGNRMTVKPNIPHHHTNWSTSKTSLLSWQSSSVVITPTSNQQQHDDSVRPEMPQKDHFKVVQHCE